MPGKDLKKLLIMHFNKQPDTSRLEHLEQDVWRKIRMQPADVTLPWYEKMVLALSVPQFRFASIVMAVVIGLSFSPVMSPSSDTSVTDIMGLNVFSASAPYLLNNQFAGNQ